MSKWHFLVVEDDHSGQIITQEILEHENIQVDIAGDADFALQLLESRAYTATIIDLSLPGKSGWELLQLIHDNPKTLNMPCFAITAFHSPQIAQKAVKAGFKAYFSKPIRPDSFVQDIRAYLAS